MKVGTSITVEHHVLASARQLNLNVSQIAEDALKTAIGFRESSQERNEIERKLNEVEQTKKHLLIELQTINKISKDKEQEEQTRDNEEKRKDTEISKVIAVLIRMRNPERFAEKQANALRKLGIDITKEELMRRVKER